ncbi:MAG TPA: SlyX family protein [Spirochaetota bacterium]|nr:SlyX family protein [Spirochaetota bacterium]HQO40935.1 SlyX family protein [Spirochaetota bacterium]
METEERIVSLETKMAYLEHYVQELNQVVLDQEKTIRLLLHETEAIKKQLDDKKEKLPENEKPPHY